MSDLVRSVSEIFNDSKLKQVYIIYLIIREAMNGEKITSDCYWKI